jgi:hypothetical protein
LIGEYRASIDEVLQTLSASNLSQAVEIARIPRTSAATATSRSATSRRRVRSGRRLMAGWRAGSQKLAA